MYKRNECFLFFLINDHFVQNRFQHASVYMIAEKRDG